MATPQETNMVVVGILVGLIIVLTIILILLLIRPVMDFIRARLPENRKRKEMRYRTIEGWVISKVSAIDDIAGGRELEALSVLCVCVCGHV